METAIILTTRLTGFHTLPQENRTPCPVFLLCLSETFIEPEIDTVFNPADIPEIQFFKQ